MMVLVSFGEEPKLLFESEVTLNLLYYELIYHMQMYIDNRLHEC
jgi:hypothetical protein